MAALTTDRNTPRKYVERLVCDDLKVAANTTIYNGAMAATNAAGDLVPASDAANLTVQGRAPQQMVNATGAAALVSPKARIEAGVFKYDNAAANGCTAADVGKNCYVVDDHTVGKIAATANSIVAGTVDTVLADGVYVKINC